MFIISVRMYTLIVSVMIAVRYTVYRLDDHK